MSVDNIDVLNMEEMADMQQEIMTILEDQGRTDLIQVFKTMLDKCGELNYETESTPSSEDIPDLETEEEIIKIKTDTGGFKSIV